MIKENTHFLIVGLGLLGGSYAKGLHEAGFEVDAIDINSVNLEFAKDKGWINQCSTMMDEMLLQEADIVIFGVYPKVITEWVKQAMPYFKKNAIITDVTGIKGAVVESIQSILREDLEFVGAHPMAGREVSGAVHSDNKIFKPANFIITPTNKNTEKGIQMIHDLAEILGFAHITQLSVDEHDKMISFVSQLTHVIAVTLMNTNDNTHLVEYTGDSFRDLTRIAKINEYLWSELFLMNKQNLLNDIDDFMKELNHFRDVLEKEDDEEMKRLFRQSTQRRKLFDK